MATTQKKKATTGGLLNQTAQPVQPAGGYDPETGVYTESNEGVAGRMTDLLSKDNAYMKQATTAGMKAANRRGLLNSSMAVGAIEDSRIKAAMPIASQEASQAHQTNLTGRSLQMQDVTSKRDTEASMARLQQEIESREGISAADRASREGIAGRDIESREGMQRTDIESREGMQQSDIESRQSMQLADIAAAKERLGMQLTQEERLALEQISSRENIAGMEISAAEQRQLADIAATKERLGMQLTQQERLALEEIQSREGMAEREIEAQQQMQLAEIAAAKERLGLQLSQEEELAMAEIASREGMQQADIDAQNQRLAQELGSREALQTAELAAAKERLGMQLTQQEQLAADELNAAKERLEMQLETDQIMAGLDRDLRERLVGMELASGDLRSAAQLAQGYEIAYSNMITGIMANPEIPATERQRYMNHAATIRDSNLALLEQFFSVDLDWGGDSGSGGNDQGPSDPPYIDTLDRPGTYDPYEDMNG